MPDPNQTEAYPSLLPGNNEYGGGWKVETVDPAQALKGGTAGAATNKQARILRVPPMQLRHDIDIRGHEEIHVMRPNARFTCDPQTHGTAGHTCNVWRDRVRQILEEVAVDSDGVNKHLHDMREARDEYNYAAAPVPNDEFHAAIAVIQEWTSAQINITGPKHEALLRYHDACRAVIEAHPDGPRKLEVLDMACQGVWDDTTETSCAIWADYVAANFVPTKVPPVMPTIVIFGGSTSSEDDDDSESESEADETDPEDEDEEDDDTGEDEEDDDGTASASGLDQSDEEGSGEGPTSAAADGGISPEKETQRITQSTQSPMTPGDFEFDPLAGEQNMLLNEPLHPPEPYSTQRQRTALTKQELADEMARDTAERKLGLASQSSHLTSLTPYGAVDIHRHTFQRLGSVQVASAWRPTDAGSTVRYPSYLHTNAGRIFGTKARGGTIVVDSSGSMDWHHDIIRDAMESGAMPNLCVIRYSYHGTSYRKTGGPQYIARLCIIAMGGRFSTDDIKDESEHTGGNDGADGASLYYAAKFLPHPLVWVSDGMVSFGDDDAAFYRQCDAVMAQHKIPRVLTLEDAVGYLRGNAVPGWYQCRTEQPHFIRLGGVFLQQSSDPRSGYREAQRWSRLRRDKKIDYSF